MLAMVILMVSAKVIHKIPKSRITGEVNPKVCPKLKKLLGNILPINPPKTMPARTNKKQVQLFLCFTGISFLSCVHFLSKLS